jgi:acyl-homoserine lactone acylase PvdQ
VIAKVFTPKMIEIARQAAPKLSADKRIAIESIFKYLEDWDGRFNLDSIGATCYTYTHYFFVKSLMHRFYPDDEPSRLKIVEQISFIDYL